MSALPSAHFALPIERDGHSIASTPAVIYVRHDDGMPIAFDGGWMEFTGLSCERSAGGEWLQAIHPSDACGLVERWARLSFRGEPDRRRLRLRRADGAMRWMQLEAIAVRGAAQTIAEWVGCRVDDEDVIAESDAPPFVTLSERSRDFVAVARHDGSLLHVNAVGRKLVNAGEAMPAVINGFFAREEQQRIASEIVITVGRAGQWRGEVMLRDQSTGDAVPVLANVFAIEDPTNSGKLAMAWIGSDLRQHKRIDAALRESEAFNRRLLESHDDVLSVLDTEGRLMAMNERGRRALGIDDLRGFLGRSWITFWDERIHDEVVAALGRATNGDAGRFVGPCLTIDGRATWWDVVITPIASGGDGPERFLVVSRDVTERVRVERRARFLADAGSSLLDARDAVATHGNIARAAVQGFADFCFIDRVVGDRTDRLAAAVRSGGELAEKTAVRQMLASPDRLVAPAFAGNDVLVPEVEAERIARAQSTRESSGIARKTTSLIAVPVKLAGCVHSVIIFGLTTASGDRRFDAADLEVARALTRALALSHTQSTPARRESMAG